MKTNNIISIFSLLNCFVFFFPNCLQLQYKSHETPPLLLHLPKKPGCHCCILCSGKAPSESFAYVDAKTNNIGAAMLCAALVEETNTFTREICRLSCQQWRQSLFLLLTGKAPSEADGEPAPARQWHDWAMSETSQISLLVQPTATCQAQIIN